MRHSDSIIRQCSRCGRELVDAASRECGIGPVCRKKDTVIFARQMKADLTRSSILFLSLKPEDFHPEAQERFLAVKTVFLRQLAKAQKLNDDFTRATVEGGDFREIVDFFDYSLSFSGSYAFRNKLINIIDMLGYQALAGVLKGDVCMSPAKIYIEDGSIFLEAKSSKDGWRRMRMDVPGVITPRYRGDKTPYQASVRYAESFLDVCLRHWPFNNANVEELLAEAKKATKTIGPEAKVSKLPLAHFTPGGLGFKLSMPWHGSYDEMSETIFNLKKIAYRERKYDPSSKTWSFKLKHLELVKGLVSDRYTVHSVMELHDAKKCVG